MRIFRAIKRILIALINAFKVFSRVMADSILGSFGYLNSTVFPILGLLGPILGLLRLNKKLVDKKFIKLMYWIGVLFTFDFVFTVVSHNLKVVAIGIAVYLFLLLARALVTWLQFMTPVQYSVVPIILMGLLVKSGELSTVGSTCENVRRTPGMEILTDTRYNHTQVPHTAIPRYMLYRPDRNDILVCNHVYVYEENILLKKSINRLDLETGLLETWHKKGEVLAIAEDPDNRHIFAVMQKNFRDPKAPDLELIEFSPDGDIVKRTVIDVGRGKFIKGSIYIFPDRLIIQVECFYFVYHRGTDRLEQLKIEGHYETPVYNTVWVEPHMYGTYAMTPVYVVIHMGRNLLKVNIDESKLDGFRSNWQMGFYDIKKWPGKDLLVVSRHLGKGGVIFDYNLKEVGTLNIPAGVREIAFTNDGKYLFAADFVGGLIHVLDLETNKIIAESYIGSGTRGMETQEDGSILVGCSCGVVRIDPEPYIRNQTAYVKEIKVGK